MTETLDTVFSLVDISGAKAARLAASRQCPYLDTIDRGVLDFDFEKLCSISLSRINCYACLVCGKYFQVMISWNYLRQTDKNRKYFRVVETTLMHTLIQSVTIIVCSSTSRLRSSTVYQIIMRLSTPVSAISSMFSTRPSPQTWSRDSAPAPGRPELMMAPNIFLVSWVSIISRYGSLRCSFEGTRFFVLKNEISDLCSFDSKRIIF